MIFNYDDMEFFRSGEWQYIEEKLSDMRKSGAVFCPKKEDIFASLDACPFENTRAVIVGQDPYPNPDHATGVAFSIPKHIKTFPATLANIIQEYSTDTHLPQPKNGDLTKWCENGVLLWNAIPTCEAFKPLSHLKWVPEYYSYLNKELFERLSAKGIVFVIMGRVAQDCVEKYIDQGESDIIYTSHPSPRGVLNSRTPFIGSRIFTTVNDKLANLGVQQIDWKL